MKETTNYNMGLSGAFSGAFAAQQQMQDCARQNAKGALRDRLARLRREAEQLEALLKALPEELPAAADAALWDMAISHR